MSLVTEHCSAYFLLRSFLPLRVKIVGRAAADCHAWHCV